MGTFHAGKDGGGGMSIYNEPEHFIHRADASLVVSILFCPSTLSFRVALTTVMEMVVSASLPHFPPILFHLYTSILALFLCRNLPLPVSPNSPSTARLSL